MAPLWVIQTSRSTQTPQRHNIHVDVVGPGVICPAPAKLREETDVAQYNPAQLQESVTRLQSKARSIAALYAVMGMGIGALTGQYLDEVIGVAGMTIIAPLLMGLIAFVVGRERAFHLTLDAQNTLCRLRLAEAMRELLVSSKRKEFVTRSRSNPEDLLVDATGTD